VLLVVLTSRSAQAQKSKPRYTILHSFGSGKDGSIPQAGLVQAKDGNFYGTTSFGGAHSGKQCGGTTCGTIFKITPGGTLTILHSFNGADGFLPYVGVIQGADGNFYGTTFDGGKNGFGTVYKITPTGRLTTLHSFKGTNGTEGANPWGLVQAINGNFYGATVGGGSKRYGTIFKITPMGRLTTLHSFEGADGEQPAAALVQAADGNFYGTAVVGGANGDGTIFKITPSGKLTTLHSFDGADGENPVAGLVQAANRNFYGTTFGSSGANGSGTVFKITPTGTLTTLHTFNGTDGANPVVALIQASDENLYGTVFDGGTNNLGTVFRITLNGKLTTLYNFDAAEGDPYAPLVQATNGRFYGTTQLGGTNNRGTVFSLALGVPLRLSMKP